MADEVRRKRNATSGQIVTLDEGIKLGQIYINVNPNLPVLQYRVSGTGSTTEGPSDIINTVAPCFVTAIDPASHVTTGALSDGVLWLDNSTNPAILKIRSSNTWILANDALITDLGAEVQITPGLDALPNAIAYVKARALVTGARVTIKAAAGTYTHSNTVFIDFPGSNQLYIEGVGQTTIFQFDGMLGILTSNGGGLNLSNCLLQGNGLGGPTATGAGIYGQNNTLWLNSNVTINNFGAYGIGATTGNNRVFCQATITNCQLGAIYIDRGHVDATGASINANNTAPQVYNAFGAGTYIGPTTGITVQNFELVTVAATTTINCAGYNKIFFEMTLDQNTTLELTNFRDGLEITGSIGSSGTYTLALTGGFLDPSLSSPLTIEAGKAYLLVGLQKASITMWDFKEVNIIT